MLRIFVTLEAIDRELGNTEAFAGGFDYKTPERGVATHIFAAFEPSLRGKSLTQRESNWETEQTINGYDSAQWDLFDG